MCVSGYPSMKLMKCGLPQQNHQPSFGNLKRATESIEVNEAAAGRVETLIKTPERFPQFASEEQCIRFSDRLKPAIHRRFVHCADFEKAVAVVGPIDFVEQRILAS